MARPLRLEFAGALYHVTSRGDRREDIYLDEVDRQEWLTVLAEVCDRFNWVMHAYCEMTNHYHLLVETVDGNLSRGMRQLNGLYTQRFNRRHKQVGHLFQGRYKAILVQREAHLLELTRYIVLNPVRAGMVPLPEQWHWSSYDFCVRDQHAPPWLDTDWLLGQFGVKRDQARVAYAKFVLDGVGLASPLLATRHQLLLGDDEFVEKYQHQLRPEDLRDVSIAHRRAISLPLHAYHEKFTDRNEAMAQAYRSGVYSMAEIAAFFSVHYITVSRAVRAFEAKARL
ncbi:transposase [Undibacterium sp. Ji83W]|uniref:transposase n=1 Tax=Undibacterium sp. Ji83W TaxID=3413043 RepID=UPI003BF0A09E